MTTSSQQQQQHDKKLPSLIVFDLDNTLWTPELYQIRKQRQQTTNTQQQQQQQQRRRRRRQALNNQYNDEPPLAHRDITLFPTAQTILQSIKRNNNDYPHTKFAIASRTKSVTWAHDLLRQFELTDIFDYVEIFPGDKTTHFKNLKDKSGVKYEDMLFFDDARDGRFGNCVPVSQLGVLSVHCPKGLCDDAIWFNALERFAEIRHSSSSITASSSSSLSGIIELDGTVTTITTTTTASSDYSTQQQQQRYRGVIKMVNHNRRFGFIRRRHQGRPADDIFFHFSALPPHIPIVNEGDEVSFTLSREVASRGKKDAALDIAVISPSEKNSNNNNDDDNDDATITMRTFSMNLPFAALLANGYKTLETRNGTMFVPYPPGTKMLLQVGRRTYPDGNRHVDIMRRDIDDEDEITSLKSLPEGYGKGMAVAIVELGRTFDTTVEERCEKSFERRVGAYGEESGRRATEIRRVEYLTRGVKVSGRGGVFKVKVEKSVIPEGWLDDDS